MINIGEGLKALDLNCYLALFMSTMFNFDAELDGNNVSVKDKRVISEVDFFVFLLLNLLSYI